MRNLLLLMVMASHLTSCCLFTSRDCGCKTSEPYIIESTKEWIAPFESEELTFVISDTTMNSKKITRKYQTGTECIGGDECCTSYPTYITSFSFGNNSSTLLYTRALKNTVEFSSRSSGFSADIFIATLDVNSGKFSKSDEINLSESDTIVSGKESKIVVFQRIDPSKMTFLFNRIEFVKGIGIISFTDTLGQVWTRK